MLFHYRKNIIFGLIMEAGFNNVIFSLLFIGYIVYSIYKASLKKNPTPTAPKSYPGQPLSRNTSQQTQPKKRGLMEILEQLSGEIETKFDKDPTYREYVPEPEVNYETEYVPEPLTKPSAKPIAKTEAKPKFVTLPKSAPVNDINFDNPLEIDAFEKMHDMDEEAKDTYTSSEIMGTEPRTAMIISEILRRKEY